MQMLLGHHLGLKGNVKQMLLEKQEKAVELKNEIDELLRLGKEYGWFRPSAIYQFFPAYREGNSIHILDPAAKIKSLRRLHSLGRKSRRFYALPTM